MSGAGDTPALLDVRGLSGGYGRVPILHGLGFQVAENEVVGVLGHNGMGKTTLLKTLMGFLAPTAGTVRFRDSDITAATPHARARSGIGVASSSLSLPPVR